MMRISDPNLIYYACIAKATTVLAEFNSKDADLGSLAIKCLEKTPPLHSVFSHTVRNRTYTFLIDDLFSYFVIFDAKLDNSEGLAFLKSVKEAFNGLKSSANKRLDALTSHCLQGEFNPVFHQLLSPNPVIGGLDSPSLGISFTSDESSDLSRGSGNGPVGMPLLADPVVTLKKKRRTLFGECSGGEARKGVDLMSDRGLDPSVDGPVGLSRDFSLIMNKNVLYSGDLGHSQKAKKNADNLFHFIPKGGWGYGTGTSSSIDAAEIIGNGKFVGYQSCSSCNCVSSGFSSPSFRQRLLKYG